jgi:NitT/TauT family transport system permease protein
MRISFTKNHYLAVASVAVMLVIWQLLAVYFGSGFIVPPPGKTFLTALELFTDKNFIKIVGVTILRGLTGFFISAFLGLLIGIMAGISDGFNSFFRPVLVTVRSVPVIALVLLALIWFSPGFVPVFIAMLTMFPFICTNVIDGIRSVDPAIVEMARFYQVRPGRIVSEVHIPAIMPFIISGASSAMGIGWRAIVIGEVLSQPRYGIGTMMQAQQTYLNVDAVIAWTIIAVLISYIFEKMIRWSEHKLVTWRKA